MNPRILKVDAPLQRAVTVIYVHGIGNKPPADVLKCQWDHALFGFDLGERSRLAYWVNRSYYPEPSPGGCLDADYADDTSSAFEKLGATGLTSSPQSGTGPSADEQEILDQIERAMLRPPAAKNTPEAKILPLPAGAREWVVRRITKAFLKDVHDLFFDAERRRAMRASLEERLIPGGGPYVIIGHSQGSMIAYDVLSRLSGAAQAPDVRLFVTIGSPLGIKEVQDQLKKMTGQKELRVPKCVRQWLNVSDILDPVALDHRLANDYKPAGGVKVEDKIRTNPDSPAHPHSGSGYLRLAEVRDTVRDAVRTELFQPVTSFTIAREVARSFEAGSPVERHEVLIELVDGNLDEAHKRLGEELGNLVGDAEAAQIEHLKRFVAARLTRQEAEILATRVGELAGKAGVVRRVWRNSVKRALDNYSVHTVQALPAHEAYHAYGDGVEWAVLDTGLESSHPHFGRGKKSLIVAEHDCTRPGGIVTGPGQARDRVGHGTHVAGIVAGGMDRLMVDPSGRAFPLVGMAPKCNLRIYKVLDDNGEGLDSWIIRALDHIAEINERHARLVVHGVNLSLGGPFDATSYGCGFSPLCRELARLWRQGVLIVVAAGNEGMRAVYGPRETFTANMDLSISDPANMENCIAVGSVNKVNPHSYGVSYFSSRGPTADGRCKPDVVAPGEKILSCRHDFTPSENRVDDLYVEMSGTSMAAPHVSGILAAFLSKRSEFKGQPDRVKDILLTNCTDLKRDRTFQGAGLPNLVKMLVAT